MENYMGRKVRLKKSFSIEGTICGRGVIENNIWTYINYKGENTKENISSFPDWKIKELLEHNGVIDIEYLDTDNRLNYINLFFDDVEFID